MITLVTIVLLAGLGLFGLLLAAMTLSVIVGALTGDGMAETNRQIGNPFDRP